MANLVDPNRSLASLKDPIPGFIYALRCTRCRHYAGFPTAVLLKKFGNLTPLKTVLPKVKCGKCEVGPVEAIALRLCEPGCAKQR